MKRTKKRKIESSGRLELANPLFWQILNKGRTEKIIEELWRHQHMREAEYRYLLAFRKQNGIEWPKK